MCAIWSVILFIGLLWVRGIHGKKRSVHIVNSFEYTGIRCRAHNVSIKDFGGVGDGKTSNNRAFHDAIAHLAQFLYWSGGLLYVPAGRWLTGNFNQTSHFTLYLTKDDVVLASKVQVSFPFGGFRLLFGMSERLYISGRF